MQVAVARRRRLRRVSLPPLIDVVFILLVFFMLQTSFLRPAALELGAPARAGGEPDAAAPIRIEAHADGSLWLDGARVTLAGLPARLARRAPEPGTRVVLASDRPVPLQRLVRIMDLLHARGLRRVALVEARRFAPLPAAGQTP